MGKLRELLPIINIWKWSNGDEYTIDDEYADVELTTELAESSEMIEVKFEEHFKSLKESTGKGKFGKEIKLSDTEKGKSGKKLKSTEPQMNMSNSKETIKEDQKGRERD